MAAASYWNFTNLKAAAIFHPNCFSMLMAAAIGHSHFLTKLMAAANGMLSHTLRAAALDPAGLFRLPGRESAAPCV